MLKSWSLTNFKTFRERQDIVLSGINVFVGANSSGKSSIIQSILLLKQTIRYGAPNRTLVLNGPISKLGTFVNVKNDLARPEDHISVSCELRFGSEDAKLDPEDTWNAPWQREFYYPSAITPSDTIDQIYCDLDWNNETNAPRKKHRGTGSNFDSFDDLYPTLISGRLTATTRIQSSRHYWYYTAPEAPLTEPQEDLNPGSEPLPYATELDFHSREEIASDAPDAKIQGTRLRNFLPVSTHIDFDRRKLQAQMATEVIFGDTSPGRFNHIFPNFQLPERAGKLLSNWSVQYDEQSPQPSSNLTIENARQLVRRLVRRRSPRGLLFDDNAPEIDKEQLSKELLACLFEALPEQRAGHPAAPRALSVAQRVARGFLSHGVRYLGPLRDEPRPVYPVEVLEDPTEIGYRGEHTAAVLELNRHRRVNYIPAREVSAQTFKRRQVSLAHAVNDWAEYLGVASNVTSKDAGVFGHQLQVGTGERPGRLRDLTNVGVGVSQALPILVMALLAPRGSVLIFEQPELHLHPKVQARLGDFFLACERNNKQCIIETHSEYLIDRLRRRVAENSTANFVSCLSVFFVERDGSRSSCRKVEVSEFGAFAEWPKDFFDQSANEAEAILRAASEKRSKS